MLADPFDFCKDGRLLARLSDASALGDFTAYKCIQVTAEGRRRGYFDLTCGELVNVPHSQQQRGERKQCPLLDGMVCRILLGERKAGASKKAASEKALLCLSLVQKQSRYADEINNPLGLYDPHGDDGPLYTGDTHWSSPLNDTNYKLVLTSLLYRLGVSRGVN